MDPLKLFSLIGLLVYFGVLLVAVTREKKNTSLLDYFFAGRNLPFWALSITFIASWWGAGSALSTADLGFTDGLGAFWYYGVPVLLSTFLMILLSAAIRKIGYLTQGKMMSKRYSPGVSLVLAAMIFLFMTLSAASQMVGVGDFFGTYLGFGYETALLVGTGIVLVYSMFGGFRGVVLTDIIQFGLLVVSAVAVFAVALVSAGGWGNVVSTARAAGRPEYLSFFSGASKYFVYVLTFGCAWMIQANVWQRISATKNQADAKRMTVMSFFAYIPLYLIVVLTGMCGMVLYTGLPEGGIVPAIILDYMNPVLGAVVFVGISAAIMSTMDSLINTGAMTLVMDIYAPLAGEKGGKEESQLGKARLATLLVTAIAVLIALRIRSILEVAWVASDVISTGVFFPLVLGFVWRRGNSAGALSSMVVGGLYCGYNLLHTLGLPLPLLWESGSAMQVVLGMGLSLAVYVLVSLATPPEYEKADPFIRQAGLFRR